MLLAPAFCRRRHRHRAIATRPTPQVTEKTRLATPCVDSDAALCHPGAPGPLRLGDVPFRCEGPSLVFTGACDGSVGAAPLVFPGPLLVVLAVAVVVVGRQSSLSGGLGLPAQLASEPAVHQTRLVRLPSAQPAARPAEQQGDQSLTAQAQPLSQSCAQGGGTVRVRRSLPRSETYCTSRDVFEAVTPLKPQRLRPGRAPSA
mmetsp:Transcript_34528/g.109624  ORF Transcript_34528/g.109624 Transcript_34528/m.109624 type:complete len:202 (+) Transcript_34528:236-841(+)